MFAGYRDLEELPVELLGRIRGRQTIAGRTPC